MLKSGTGVPRIVDPERDRSGRVHERGRRPADRRRSRRARCRRADPSSRPASARRRARARRSGRAGRGRGSRAARPAAVPGGRSPAAPPRRPRSSPSSASRCVEQRRGDAGDEVRTGAVPRERMPGLEDLGRHRGRGRLAVRRGDDRRAVRQAPGEGVDRARIELPEQLARQRRSTAGARETREPARGSGGERFDGETGAHRARAYPQR